MGKYIAYCTYRIPKDESKRKVHPYVERDKYTKVHTTSLLPSGTKMDFPKASVGYVGVISCFKNYDDMVWCSEQSKYNRIIGTSPKNMQYRCVLRFDGRHYNDDDCELMRRNLENIENVIGGWENGEAHITKTALRFQNNDFRIMPNTVTMDFKDEVGMIAATSFLEDRNRYKVKLFEYQKW